MAGLSSKALAFGNPENRQKFNSIENTTEFNLNVYDAFFRTNDPQIGRWWQIDPEVESFFALTPYNSMGNNPVIFNDPRGDKFDKDSKDDIEAIKKNIKQRQSDLIQLRKQLQGSLTKAKKSKDNAAVKGLQQQLRDNSSMQNELGTAITEINEMDRSDQLFILNHFDKISDKTEGGTTYLKDKNAIVIGYTDFASATHELKHGFDFLKGELSYTNLRSFDPKNPKEFNKAVDEQLGRSLYDYNDEVRAFKRSYSMRSTNATDIFNGKHFDQINSKDPNLRAAYHEYNPSETPKNTSNTTVHKNEVIYKSHRN